MLPTPADIQSRLERLLLRVQKPGRYVGGELNQVVKEWDNVQTRLALVFPDIYDIGLPNLGLAALYELLNQRSDVLAERAYAPWVDMETLLRENDIPLYSLETFHPLAAFDIIGISLPYETLYTNALNILDLSGIPLFSHQRTENHPLIIAGGHAAFNPEPMSDFIDAFVIGEGEEVIHEIVNCYQTWKRNKQPRAVLLKNLAHIWGVYVPVLYEPQYRQDGTLASINPLFDDVPKTVTKRIVACLPPAPTHLIVPSIDIVHNRIPIEIMRGCTRGCRFCHAGMVNRPIRERSVEEIVNIIQTALQNTGFEEIALLSLSSSDYAHIDELVEVLGKNFADRNLKVSLPSLRIDTFSVHLMEKLRTARSGNFTLAPEAATERMRNIINKPISSQLLIDTAREIYARKWPTLKLYFMIGHPHETLEDVHAIAELCKTVMAEGRKAAGRRVALHVSVSTFVPKPHTPFQWVACDSIEQIDAKIALLQRELKNSGIKLSWTDPKKTLLEAWLSRGDRRLGQVIFTAWKLGAKFDAWQDQSTLEFWETAFKQSGLDPDFYTYRPRDEKELFPWDHIHTGVNKSFLLAEYRRSLRGELLADCRETCTACGISATFAGLRRTSPNTDWRCP
ncbi:MAG: TIGR03960 family B12-binding radical SAM protein [Anaerolineae bacterium]|nr:TIGR03960 family B12-binding radical SAM protein [Anaerolineae bacterium]